MTREMRNFPREATYHDRLKARIARQDEDRHYTIALLGARVGLALEAHLAAGPLAEVVGISDGWAVER